MRKIIGKMNILMKGESITDGNCEICKNASFSRVVLGKQVIDVCHRCATIYLVE